MTTTVSDLSTCVSAYAARLHAVSGERHHVASPLGAWLLLALAGPASSGADRAALTQVLGCDPDAAGAAAAELLADPHPQVAAAAAAWTAAGADLGAAFGRWQRELPPPVTRGDLPGQADLDAWARDHTFGLIDRFPLGRRDDVLLVLASALATRVSWDMPFELAPACCLGAASEWSGLGQVLRTPDPSGGAHQQYVAATEPAGDVIVHAARASGGLIVVSVAADPAVPSGTVLAVAYDLAVRQASGGQVQRRQLADLPVGEQPLWLITEITASADRCTAIVPAWSAQTELELADPALGFAAAAGSLVPGQRQWDARQSAMARYSRTGFEAAAATAVAVASAARLPGRKRAAELRFGHPYAVVAACTAQGTGPGHAWNGLPVFSAWVTEPQDAADPALGGSR